MPHELIKVNTEVLDSQVTPLRTAAKTLGSVATQINKANRGLTWDISTKAQISRILTSHSNYVTMLQEFANRLADVLQNTATEYRTTESKLAGVSVEAGQTMENAGADDGSENDANIRLFEFLKSILKWVGKLFPDGAPGTAYDWVAYFESFKKFFTGDMQGLTGAEDWLNLSDKSAQLWKAIYDYLKSYYKGNGKAFSLSGQQGALGISVAGGTLGFIGALCGAIDTIQNTEGIGAAGITGEIFGTTDEIVDIGEDIYKLTHIAETAKDGVWSPVKIYTSIAKGYLNAVGQGFTSYEKYIQDGVWDLGDTAATGVESSVAGLYGMIDALTFGLISEKTTGISVEDISNALENWASDVGKSAGNYIVNDPVLMEMYNQSGTVGRALLTFYAAVRA